MDSRRVKGAAKPSQGKPAHGKPAHGKPAHGKPAPGKPAHAKPGFGKSKPAKAGFAKPGYGKPAFAKPGFAKPEFAKRDFAKPDVAKPGAGRPVHKLAHRLVDLDDVMYGVHAVNEALVAGEPLLHIHIGEERRRDRALIPLTAQAHEAGIPIRYEDRAFFNQFPYKAHQSVVAIGKPFVYADLKDIVARATPHRLLAVALDHVTDPHNVGAIIRTVECVGANGVILPDRRAAGINATVRKAAAGATAHLPVAQVTNLATALRELKAQGIWVIGADAGPGSVPYTEIDYNKSVVVVIGAEGAGLSDLIRRQCDEIAAIPLAGLIGSLNASVAAGVMLYEIRRQRMAS